MDTLTTGSDGTDTSEPLYLGRYQVLERKAPEGVVRDPEPKEVVLSYAGQEVSVTNTGVSFSNERQKVEISLKKLLEQNETFSIGMNPAKLSNFIIFCYFNRCHTFISTNHYVMPVWVVMSISHSIFYCLPCT